MADKRPNNTLALIQEVMFLLKPLIGEVTAMKKVLRSISIKMDVFDSRLRRIERILREMQEDDGK